MVKLEDGSLYHAWYRKNKLSGRSIPRWQIEDAFTGIQIGENEETFNKVKEAILAS